ncbi:hypothetical protein, partial [Lysobacter enzymogenes]|uniref:hypothetical protein n=1 Tax=Lysobacter enzymogenes TaxID=69 RepID=UPI0019D14F41
AAASAAPHPPSETAVRNGAPNARSIRTFVPARCSAATRERRRPAACADRDADANPARAAGLAWPSTPPRRLAGECPP